MVGFLEGTHNCYLEKQRILDKTLFAERIFYNVENHQHPTRNVNSFVELVSSVSNSCGENKTGILSIRMKIPV